MYEQIMFPSQQIDKSVFLKSFEAKELRLIRYGGLESVFSDGKSVVELFWSTQVKRVFGEMNTVKNETKL